MTTTRPVARAAGGRFVWYSDDWDELRVAPKSAGYLFKDDGGAFHICYRWDVPFTKLELTHFYLVGKYD